MAASKESVEEYNASKRKELHRRVREELKAGSACEICGSSERLSCHEKWHYDEAHYVQKLVGFGILCGMCHHVHHYGRSEQLASEGYLDLDAVIEHFCKVNGVARRVFEEHKREAFKVWRERSEHNWSTDLGQWSHLVEHRGRRAWR